MKKKIIMSSGEQNRHCDLYPHGSIHTIEIDENGNRWVEGRNFSTIMKKYSILEIGDVKTKNCQYCKNEFPEDWVFIREGCIRCFERRNIVNFEEYRKAIREELKREML